MGRARAIFWPCPLGRGQKVKYLLISITKSISKTFIPNFVCVLTNERYITNQMGFSFCCLGHAQGVGFWALGVPEWLKKQKFKHGHVAYLIDEDDEQDRMQLKFSSKDQTVNLRVRSKVKY